MLGRTSRSRLNRAVYDRRGDWVLSADAGGEASWSVPFTVSGTAETKTMSGRR